METIVFAGFSYLADERGIAIPPIVCPHCGATEFELIYIDDYPWWKCPNGHRIFGYWRTEMSVRRALRNYREMDGDCFRSNWVATTRGRYGSYAAWEAVIDTKVDLDREMKALEFKEWVLVRERYLDGMTVKEIAHRHGVYERKVRRWYARIIRKIAFRLGETW